MDAIVAKSEVASHSVSATDVNNDDLLPQTSIDPLAMEALANNSGMDPESIQLLKNVFKTIALNGKITLDQLPFVLAGAEVQASAKEIEEAIEQLMPDADEADALLEFEQVELLYHQLMRNMVAVQQVFVASDQHSRPSLFSRVVQWWHARQQRKKMNQTAYEKHMRPTTRLLLVILCVSCAICIAIVVVAIVLLWNFSIDNVMNHIKRDVFLMRNGMELFAWQKPVELVNQDSRQLASLVALMTSELGYKGSKQTMSGILAFQAFLMGSVMEGWFAHDSMTQVSMNSLLVKGWLGLVAQSQNVSFAIALFNMLNNNLPSGHEVMLNSLDPSTGKPIYLTNLRYASQCPGGQCMDPSVVFPVLASLSGQSGAIINVDYRPATVVAGFTTLTSAYIGVVYKIDLSVLRAQFQIPATQLTNAGNAFSIQMQQAAGGKSHEEITLAAVINGSAVILSNISDCSTTCLARANVATHPAALAAKGAFGFQETTDLVGDTVLAVWIPLAMSGLGLSVSIKTKQFLLDLLPMFGAAIDAANANFNDTREIQFVQFGDVTGSGSTNANTMTFYTTPKLAGNCGKAGCIVNATTCPYMQLVATQCADGNAVSQDYRGVSVFAGYSCSADINGAVAVKIDQSQLKSEGIGLARTIAEYQNNVRFKDSTTEFMLAQKKPGVAVVSSAGDFFPITTLKHANGCPNHVCTHLAPHLIAALQGQSGVVMGPDYRGVSVVGAYTYVESLDTALVINVEVTEAEQSSVSVAMQLAGCSVSAIIVGMAFLYVWTNRLLRSMDEAWDEGKRAIEKEKEAFGSVIRAMYPPVVAQRLLAGETHIVYNLPWVTVFFSDIYEFTTASNAITPEELIQFMSYTFGVMDATAEHFHVHKVKTIGDAYLAVAGLPGCESLNGNICLDMLLFASSCVQLFSHRYIHPESGNILGTVHKTLFGKKKAGKGGPEGDAPLPRMPSGIAYGNPALPDAAAAAARVAEPQAQCVMRYGVSNGPVTAGILQGKVPLFDIWGKTVNLASRMESTGQPGRIQVSEGVHHTLLKAKGQPFTFNSRHKVFCKGFGHVFAYFLKTCSVPPPEELLARLCIEPNLGLFQFDNGMPGYIAGGSGAYAPVDRSSTGRQSARSSVVGSEDYTGHASLQVHHQ